MQQLMQSFEGHTAPPEILKAVQQGSLAAICLFTHLNVASPAQLHEMTAQIHRAAQQGGQLTPLIAIDQEGGQLIAITNGATELPGNMALGATRSPLLAMQAGQVLGRELLAMGINLNLAPAIDVNVNPANPVIGVRSFGDDPSLVSELGAAFIKGIQGVGVLASAKHFPGHGDTDNDSHLASPVVAHDLDRMNAVELAPFRAAFEADVASIVTAHILFPSLDPNHLATLSKIVLQDFLRKELGYDGLIITDAMDMHAVFQHGGEDSVRLAIEAGVDLVLLGHIKNQLTLSQRVKLTANPASLKRIHRAQSSIPQTQPSMDVVGCAEHQQIAQQIADLSITLVRDSGQLPLRPGPDDIIAVITPQPVDLTPADTSSMVQMSLAAMLRKRHSRIQSFEVAASDSDISAVLEATKDANIVIVGTISAERDMKQVQLVQELHRRGQSPIVIALRTPYDLSVFPMVDTYLCAYGIRPVTMEALARVLFGEIEAQGVLPCVIPGVSLVG